jgi:uncharacterized protein (TIGR03084 family)
MSADTSELTDDLAAETADLVAVLRALREDQWASSTPAEEWTVRDQVTHLAYFDEAATLAATDAAGFQAVAAELTAGSGNAADRVAARFRGLPGAEVLGWFERARAEYLTAFAQLDPRTQLPWFGPPMSAASSVTARLMETWAHGQDVLDAVGRERRPTARLRHVAHLGVRTLGWSFRVRGLPEPTEPVRVELSAPDGGRWTWGPETAAARVTGSAEGFCLLVTQRRHRDECDVTAVGPVADTWLGIAQAFAGPPGRGRTQRSAPGGRPSRESASDVEGTS